LSFVKTRTEKKLASQTGEENRDKYRRYLQATNRVFLLWLAMEAALEWERREILAILQEHHPKVAKRILASLAREPKQRRKRRRKAH
jgi:hypothetical protein